MRLGRAGVIAATATKNKIELAMEAEQKKEAARRAGCNKYTRPIKQDSNRPHSARHQPTDKIRPITV